MATINELMKMAVNNVIGGGTVGIALGCAQVEQARMLLEKGFKLDDELNDIDLDEEGCSLKFSEYLCKVNEV